MMLLNGTLLCFMGAVLFIFFSGPCSGSPEGLPEAAAYAARMRLS
jgi:hypothetical protein